VAVLAAAKTTPKAAAQMVENAKSEMRFVMKASRLKTYNSLSILDLSC
jgi:hypothetical protein